MVGARPQADALAGRAVAVEPLPQQLGARRALAAGEAGPAEQSD